MVKIQDGSGRDIEFWKMSIYPDWMEIHASNSVDTFTTAICRGPRYQQEAQLSQRGSAMPRIVEHFG